MTFENETSENEIESSATEGASLDASEGSEGTGEQAKVSAPKQEQESAPFHEHPRFKELVEQKNQALSAQKQLEQRLAQFEQRFNQPQQQSQGPSKEQTEFDALVQDLKKVDPRLAAQIESAAKAQSTVTQLQQRLENFEKAQAENQRQAQVQSAVSKINSLHDSNKVSPEVKALINDKLDLLYMQGKLNLQNLESEYKNNLDGFNKVIEAVKRAERESYVASKKQDSSVPTSQPKGTPAKPAPKKPNWSKDPEQARAQIVSRFLKQSAANKEAGSV